MKSFLFFYVNIQCFYSKKKSKMPGYIYVLHNEMFNYYGKDKYYKVGYTECIERRKFDEGYTLTFKTPSYYKCYYMLTDSEEAQKCETEIHRKLRQIYNNNEHQGRETYCLSFFEIKREIDKYLKEKGVSYTRYDEDNITKKGEKERNIKIVKGTEYYIISGKKKEDGYKCELCKRPIYAKIFVVKSKKNNNEYYGTDCAKTLPFWESFPVNEFKNDSDDMKLKYGQDFLREIGNSLRESEIENFGHEDPYILLCQMNYSKYEDLVNIDKEILEKSRMIKYVNSVYRTLFYFSVYMRKKRKHRICVDDLWKNINNAGGKLRERLQRHPLCKTNLGLINNKEQSWIDFEENSKIIISVYYADIEKKIEETLKNISEVKHNIPFDVQSIDKFDDYFGDKPDRRKYIEESLKYSVVYINGCAGSGKTVMASAMIRLCYNAGYRVIITAPSALAAHSMKSELFDHMFYGKLEHQREEDKKVSSSTIHSLYKLTSIRDSKENLVIVIDEISMISLEIIKLFDQFISEIKGKKVKLIFTGDAQQLPPVGVGCFVDIMEDLIEKQKSNEDTVYEITLEENMRTDQPDMQKNLKELRNLCEKSAIDKKSLDKLSEILTDIKPDTFKFRDVETIKISEYEKIPDNIYDTIYDKYYSGQSDKDVIILCPKNELRKEINKKFCEKRIKEKGLSEEDYLKTSCATFIKGEKVIVTENRYVDSGDIGFIFNGEIWIFKNYEKCKGELSDREKEIVESNEKRKVDWSNYEYYKLTLYKHVKNGKESVKQFIYIKYFKHDNYLQNCYALTVHKAQGRGYDHVYFIHEFDKDEYDPINMKLLYTALSRMKKTCCLVTNISKKEYLKKIEGVVVSNETS